MVRDYYPAVDGGSITCDLYEPLAGKAYANWILKWNSGGGKYERKRNVSEAATRAHGAIEPVAYLHALKALVNTNPSDAKRTKPTPAAVAEQVRLHRAEFESMVAAFPHAAGP